MHQRNADRRLRPPPTPRASRCSARASPTANTRGRLVSSMYRRRLSGQRALPGRWRASRSRPVRMNPRSSSTRQPRSHSVRGDAPVITKTCPTPRVSISPVFRFRQVTCSRHSLPSSATISVFQCISILRILRQSLDQIARHGAGKLARPHQHVHLAGMFATGTPRPARRSCRRPPPPPPRLRTTAIRYKWRRSRCPCPSNFCQIRKRRLVVLRARGDHDRARAASVSPPSSTTL